MNAMFLGLIFSSIGLGYFMYGKKVTSPVFRVTGLVLMVYPYFVQNIIAITIMGVALILLPKYYRP
jgi:hypothetical protein